MGYNNQGALYSSEEEYQRECFHLALTVVVNALEVVVTCCQQQQDDEPQHQRHAPVVENCFQTATGHDLLHTWRDCIGQAETNLHIAYLATKALRLVGQACPHLLLRTSWKNKLEAPVCKAMQMGYHRHALLLSKSKKLWDWLNIED